MLARRLKYLPLLAILALPLSVRADNAIENLLVSPVAVLSGQNVDAAALRQVYMPVGFERLWRRQAQVEAVLEVLSAAGAHALNPDDYHVSTIRALDGEPQQALARDLLLTEGLMRYIADVRGGVVNPRNLKGERFSPLQVVDPVKLVQEAAKADDLKAFLAALPPRSPVYAGLVRLLAKLQQDEAAGGWPVLADGPKIEPGENSRRIVTLRRRLAATGELGSAANDDSPLYDKALVEAVKAYQADNGLTADGVVGRGTRAMLNVPLAQRIAQVKANLERLRWQPDDLGDRYVYVNIPGYEMVAGTRDKVDLNMKVIVGRPKRATPIFADNIRMVEFNPDWHVPPTIAREDVLPHLIEDPNYALEHKNVRIYRDGHEVDPHTVDWRKANIRDYRLRAEPGPRNPLGTVKFLFPNRFDVYLHDTNERNLFTKDERAMSSGCVRIADPDAFANWLLGADQDNWSDERRQKILDSRKQTRLILRNPVPVYLVYITAWQGDDGQPAFRPDIYDLDGPLAEALATPDTPARRLTRIMARAAARNAPAEPVVPAEEIIKAAP